MQVYNPVTKLTYDVNFDVVSDQHAGLQPSD